MGSEIYAKSEIAVKALMHSIDCYRSKDYISSIILSGASRQILNDLCRANSLPTTVEKISETTRKTRAQVHEFVAQTYNSLKHADKDPEKPIEVSGDEAKMLILLASADLARLNYTTLQDIKLILEFAYSLKEK